MSQADEIFISMCRDILDNGTSTEGEKVRPHWEDGTSAYTIKQFGVVNRYDLRKEFPAITLRRTALKSCMDEILWVWQRKSNNIHDLKPHIWDEWADENGSIGKAYGYQMGVKHKYREGMFDQTDRVLWELKNEPFSRRIVTSLYNHHDLSEMGLYPCAWSVTFNVTQHPGDEKLTLNMILNQRSQDVLAANNWNVCQYAILLMMIAQVSGMIPGQLVHEGIVAGTHVRGQIVGGGAETVQLLYRGRGVVRHDVGADTLPPGGVGDPHHHAVPHAGEAAYDLLQLGGVDVFSHADDHVVLAPQ